VLPPGAAGRKLANRSEKKHAREYKR